MVHLGPTSAQADLAQRLHWGANLHCWQGAPCRWASGPCGACAGPSWGSPLRPLLGDWGECGLLVSEGLSMQHEESAEVLLLLSVFLGPQGSPSWPAQWRPQA